MPRAVEHHRAVGSLDGEAKDLRTFADQTLSGRVLLDGATFERCRFRKAALVYVGGAPPVLRDCVFEGASFQFAGAAGNTVAFLKSMTTPASGLSSVFKATFPRLFGH
jgi:hypothetical protein